MIESIAMGIAALFLIAAMIQAGFAAAFSRLLIGHTPAPLAIESCPPAAILLPLRGADDRLEETLRFLIHQDHPHYTVHVIIDSELDPSLEVARRVATEPNGERLRIAILAERRTTCGLQCSALVQAAEGLDDSVVDVATIDGDVIAHRTWLRELVAPLRDPAIGATFGNRWFSVGRGEWGSVVRYLWNVAAIVPMWLFGIPWGGSFAIKKRWLHETGLIDHWKRGMVHDAPVPALLRDRGVDVRFVPSLMMPIGEACNLGFCFQFLKRQMLWTRLYHPNFSVLTLHAVATSGLAVAIAVATVWAVTSGRWQAAAWLAGSAFAYLITMIALLRWVERSVRIALERRGNASAMGPSLSWHQALVAIPLTQGVYTAAVWSAQWAREVVWRGVRYLIRGPLSVERISDAPSAHHGAGRGVSL